MLPTLRTQVQVFSVCKKMMCDCATTCYHALVLVERDAPISHSAYDLSVVWSRKKGWRQCGSKEGTLLFHYTRSLQLLSGPPDAASAHILPSEAHTHKTHMYTHTLWLPPPLSPLSLSHLTYSYPPHIHTLLKLLCCVDRASFGSKHIWRTGDLW